MVDLPEPVGPVTSIAPVGRRNNLCELIAHLLREAELLERRRLARLVEQAHRDRLAVDGRQRRHADVEHPPAAVAFKEIRPSCGLRRSATSSFASTFKRVVTPAAKRFGMLCATRSTPSIRNRTTSALSCGSKWMSLARSSAAWKTIEFTSRTSGPSEIPSSASRSSSSSSSTTSTSSISSAFSACDARVSAP